MAMNRKLSDNQIVEAGEMRGVGMSYRAIGTALGVGKETVRCALDPQAKERQLVGCAEYAKGHREEKRLYDVSYHKGHAEKKIARASQWQKDHRELHNLANAKYQKGHLSERAARCAERRAFIAGCLVGATAAQKAEVREIYRKAAEDEPIRCYLCGKLIPLGDREVDHIVPVIKEGPHLPSNLAITCGDCNRKKGGKMPWEIGLLI